MDNQILLQNARIGGNQAIPNDDLAVYNHYRQMFNNFAGNPAAQRSVLAEYYDYTNPINRRKREEQAMFTQMLFGGGQTQSPNLIQFDNQQPTILNGDELVMDSGTQPVEEPGRFGFGTGKGELFGEGGLVAGITQPFRTGIINPIAAIAQQGKLPDVREIQFDPQSVVRRLQAGEISQEQALQELDQMQQASQQLIRANEQQLQNADITQAKPFLVSEQEAQDYMSNPVLGGLKAGAGIASFAVPAGGGAAATTLGRIGTAAGKGALAGGMFGFGASRPGEELDKTLEGAVLGGIAGGAFQGIGEGVKALRARGASKLMAKVDEGIASQVQELGKTQQGFSPGYQTGLSSGTNNARLNWITQNLKGSERTKALQELANIAFKEGDDAVVRTINSVYKIKPASGIQKLGQKMEESTIKVKPEVAPRGVQQAQQLRSDVAGILREQGVKKMNAEGVGIAYDKLNTKLGDVLNKSQAQVKMSDVLSDGLERASLEVNLSSPVAEKNLNRMFNKISNIGEVASAPQLAGLKRELQGEMSGIFTKLAKGNPLTEKEMIVKAFHDSIDDVLKASVPEAAPIYSQMSKLYTVSESTIPAFAREGSISSPLLFKGINIPTGDIPGKITRFVGRTLQKVPNIRMPNINIPQSNIPGIIGSTINIQPGAQTVPPMTDTNMFGQQMQDQQSLGVPGILGRSPEEIKQMALYGIMTGMLDPQIGNILLSQADKATETSKTQKEQESLNTAVGELEKLYGLGTDKSLSVGSGQAGIAKSISGAGQDIRKAIDADFNNRVTAYKNMVSMAAGILNQLRGAGTLNEGEYQVMLQNIPTEYSTEEEAASWFTNIRNMLRRGGSIPASAEEILMSAF